MVSYKIDVLVEVEHVFMEFDHARMHGLTINVMYLLQVFFDNKRWIGEHVQDDGRFVVSLIGFDPEISGW